jgi:orotate phosphoribosyltransferase
MNKETALKIFRQSRALLDGHFLLTSGLHSPQYFQCAKVLQYPQYAKLLCLEIANHFRHENIDVVISPAIGGIVAGQEVARLLGCRAIFAERQNNTMALRRGFELIEGENVLAVEDVVTTGGSLSEIIELAAAQNTEIKGAGFLVDRSGGKATFGCPRFAVFEMQVTTYKPENCPLCNQKIPLVKPGSRSLNTSQDK